MKNLVVYTQLQRQAKELGFFYESAQVQAALLAIWQNYLAKDQALATFAVCFWHAGLVLYEPGKIEVLECVDAMQREPEVQRLWFIRTSGGSLEPTTQEEVERWLTGTLDVQQYQKNVEDLQRSLRENDAPSLGEIILGEEKLLLAQAQLASVQQYCARFGFPDTSTAIA